MYFLYLISLVGLLIFGYILTKDTRKIYFQSVSLLSQPRFSDFRSKDPQTRQLLASLFFEVQNATADELFRSVRVFCAVITMPKNHNLRGTAIQKTWGKRCHKLIFISTEKDLLLGAIAINITEEKNYLWGKTKEAFKYAWKHYGNKMDWFLKADDDTYVIMENLRYMLSAYNPDDPLWFGYRFNKFTKQGYMSGGAGYVLSREAVRRFIQIAIPNKKLCRSIDQGAEDAEIGKCLDKVGVLAVDSRDDKERERFHPFVPDNHLVPNAMGVVPWFWNNSYYFPRIGLECCSSTTISFHYITSYKMYELEYFIYHLTPFGIFPPLLPYPLPSAVNITQLRKNVSNIN